MNTLSQCLSPLAPAELFARYWERAPVHVSGRAPNAHAHLFSVSAVDELLTSAGLGWPWVRFCKDGEPIPSSTYVRRRPGGTPLDMLTDVDACIGLLEDGATLSLVGLERCWPALARLTASLREDLAGRVTRINANAYLTPRSGRGFAAHFDTEDVLVLQIEGQKRWRIHRPPVELPAASQTSDAFAEEIARVVATEPPLHEIVLGPGDTLYLPRGFIHAAESCPEGHSLHVTLGLAPRRVSDVLGELATRALELCALEVGFRRSVPFAAFETAPPEGDFEVFRARFFEAWEAS